MKKQPQMSRFADRANAHAHPGGSARREDGNGGDDGPKAIGKKSAIRPLRRPDRARPNSWKSQRQKLGTIRTFTDERHYRSFVAATRGDQPKSATTQRFTETDREARLFNIKAAATLMATTARCLEIDDFHEPPVAGLDVQAGFHAGLRS
ncbi:hypothetical protein [Brevundimonas sp.]|uniref:hypothetical protein n=1 Tax=Brevundimonas sp. TaxID=1871086 RepID=UPI003D10430C